MGKGERENRGNWKSVKRKYKEKVVEVQPLTWSSPLQVKVFQLRENKSE